MVVLAKMEPAGLLLQDMLGVSVVVLILISCFLGTSSLEAKFFFSFCIVAQLSHLCNEAVIYVSILKMFSLNSLKVTSIRGVE